MTTVYALTYESLPSQFNGSTVVWQTCIDRDTDGRYRLREGMKDAAGWHHFKASGETFRDKYEAIEVALRYRKTRAGF